MNSYRYRRYFVRLAATALLGISAVAWAESCVAPTDQERQNVADYVAKKYKVAASDRLVLLKDGAANDSCFWRLEYQAPQRSPIVVFLSPDKRFITPELYDIRLDPLQEEKARMKALGNALVSGDPPAIGSKSAPVTIVEFSDFECPFCLRLKEILEKEVLPQREGKVRVVFRNFPLSMHPWAKQAAMLASCAALQNEASFWKVHDFLFQEQKDLTSDTIQSEVSDFIAANTTLDKSQFKFCVDKELSLGLVTKDLDLGQQNGVRATPTVFVNGQRYQGVQSSAQLLEIIDSAVRTDKAFQLGNSSQLLGSHVAGAEANQCIVPGPKGN